jgi:hypothetical protein
MLINIRRALTAIVSVCIPLVIFFSKITPRYFTTNCHLGCCNTWSLVLVASVKLYLILQ